MGMHAVIHKRPSSTDLRVQGYGRAHFSAISSATLRSMSLRLSCASALSMSARVSAAVPTTLTPRLRTNAPSSPPPALGLAALMKIGFRG